jgi:4-amino-4-deoxy-L-arabinose transferase-like glycosyltransferase
MVVVLVVALLPRVFYPVSRPSQWYARSVQFIYDVTHGAWGETIYSEHPGVTTMWLSGIALHLAGVTPQLGAEGAFVDPNTITAYHSLIGVLPLALVISGLILLGYVLLERLFDRAVAFSAAMLIALDPFFLSNSKVLHVDGLLTAFMATSALALLVYLRERRRGWLLLSGALGGLALLTKSPALFLLPYTALCLGVGFLFQREVGLGRTLLAGLLWVGVGVAVYFALYPAMWVDPLGTPRTIYGWAALNIEQPHLNPLYFRGQVIDHDPGLAYYLWTWGYKLTSVVWVFGLVGLLYAAADPRRARHERLTVGLLLAFAVFFTWQMVLGAKKLPRYLVPAFPAVDVIAGVGLVWWVRRVARGRARVAQAGVFLALALQVVLVLPLHPYYDTYFNALLGGAEPGIWTLSTQWQGEGVDLAGRLLNHVPRAEEQRAGSNKTVMFRQYYVGKPVRVGEEAEWYVFALNNVTRREDPQLWDFYRRRDPWAVVRLNGVPYVWIHHAARRPQEVLDVTFGSHIVLSGYDVAPGPYHPGDEVPLQLHWHALDAPEGDYTVFVHLLDEAGNLVAQQDNPPLRGRRPTTTWVADETLVDPYDVSLPPDLEPGRYALTAGLYRLENLERLPVRDAEGHSRPERRVVLQGIRVTRDPRLPRATFAWVVALLVVGVAVVVLRREPRVRRSPTGAPFKS